MVEETNIFLVRHGETEWNREQRLQGHKNSPLTSTGVEQVKRVRQALAAYSIDYAYVSPLQRAQDTIGILLDNRALRPVVAENLREINLGPWEGKTRKETAQLHPEQYRAFWEAPHLFNLEGAETFKQLQHRLIKQLEFILVERAGANVLAVSHWMAIKVVIAHYLAFPLSSLSEIADPLNGGFYRLSKRGKEITINYS